MAIDFRKYIMSTGKAGDQSGHEQPAPEPEPEPEEVE